MTESEEIAIRALEDVQRYRALEQHLSDIFGGTLTLEQVVDSLEQQLTEPDNPHPIKARILTYKEESDWDAYREIGTVEECRAAVEKQIPKKPTYKYIKYGKHKWRRKDNGEIDEWAWGSTFCNGVVCEVCGTTECVHCNPDYDKLEDCECRIWSCPTCNTAVHYKQKYCDCGQLLDWER